MCYRNFKTPDGEGGYLIPEDAPAELIAELEKMGLVEETEEERAAASAVALAPWVGKRKIIFGA